MDAQGSKAQDDRGQRQEPLNRELVDKILNDLNNEIFDELAKNETNILH